jgi:hypothetical protein
VRRGPAGSYPPGRCATRSATRGRRRRRASAASRP